MNDKMNTPNSSADLPVPVSEILRQIRVAVFVTDTKGEIIYWNRACELLFGYSEAEAVGMNISMLYHSKYEDNFTLQINRILKGERLSEQWLGVHKDGMPVWVHSDSIPFRNEQGRITYVITSAFDFRAQKNIEQIMDMVWWVWGGEATPYPPYLPHFSLTYL